MPLSHQLAELEAVGLRSGFGDDHLRLGAVKFYADGSLIGGTAAFSEPFGRAGEFVGSMYWEPDAFTDAVVRAHRAGWQVGVHAQGDRAIELALDSFAAALADRPDADPRFRIEHAGYPTAEQVVRMADARGDHGQPAELPGRQRRRVRRPAGSAGATVAAAA